MCKVKVDVIVKEEAMKWLCHTVPTTSDKVERFADKKTLGRAWKMI